MLARGEGLMLTPSPLANLHNGLVSLRPSANSPFTPHQGKHVNLRLTQGNFKPEGRNDGIDLCFQIISKNFQSRQDVF